MRVLILLLCLSLPAYAESIAFTSGTVRSSEFAYWMDSYGENLTGFERSYSAWRSPGFRPDADGSLTTYMQTWGNVVVNDITYSSLPEYAQPQNFGLMLQFSYAPIPQRFMDTRGADPINEPFSMVGTLTLRDASNASVVFDIAGQGMLDLHWFKPPESSYPFLYVNFNFGQPTALARVQSVSVPEASSLAMLIAGMVAGVFIVKRR